jgi:hypothetical protein
MLDHVLRQHGDLASRHIDRGQSFAGDATEIRVGAEAEARRGDVDADLPAALRLWRYRKGIIDFGRMCVIHAECGDFSQRQVSRFCWFCKLREAGAALALGEELEQETAQVVVVCRGQRAAVEQQSRRRFAGLAAGGFQRLGFAAVAVGLVDQLRQDGGELGGELPSLEFPDHAFDGRGLLALLFQAGQRRLKDVRRRLAEAAATLAVEIDRRRVQAQQHRRGLHCIRFGAVVVGGEFLEAELGFAAGLPEEIDIHAFGFRFGAVDQFAGSGRGEAQQDVGRLDLGALARGEFDLQRAHVVGKHAAGAESTVLFKQDIHGGGRPCRGLEGKRGGGLYRSGAGDQDRAAQDVTVLRGMGRQVIRRRLPQAPASSRAAGARGSRRRRRRGRGSPASRWRHRETRW